MRHYDYGRYAYITREEYLKVKDTKEYKEWGKRNKWEKIKFF